MKPRLRTAALLSCLFLSAGCAATTHLLNWKGTEIRKADAKHPAARIVALWEPSEGVGLDNLPTRGFAGQIMFFMQGEARPVRVDGDARIFLYDNQGTAEERAKPIHQFDFEGDALTKYLQVGMLGPSYNVFIPYVRKQPYQTECGLRVRLKSSHGSVIYSEMVSVTLPGPVPETAATTDAPRMPLPPRSRQATPDDQVDQNVPREWPLLGASLKSYRLTPAANDPASPSHAADKAATQYTLDDLAELAPPIRQAAFATLDENQGSVHLAHLDDNSPSATSGFDIASNQPAQPMPFPRAIGSFNAMPHTSQTDARADADVTPTRQFKLTPAPPRAASSTADFHAELPMSDRRWLGESQPKRPHLLEE